MLVETLLLSKSLMALMKSLDYLGKLAFTQTRLLYCLSSSKKISSFGFSGTAAAEEIYPSSSDFLGRTFFFSSK